MGWTDLLASPAQDSKGGVTFMNVVAKKLRQLTETLGRLADEELVALPKEGKGANKYEGFLLKDEGGTRSHGPNDMYTVPRDDERGVFGIPLALFTQGWIHCLEDSELAFVLMVASQAPAASEVKVDGETRLLHFGLSRDSYEAHISLNRFGLLEVRPDSVRHEDGKVVDYHGDAYLHWLKLLPEGFNSPAFPTTTQALHEALA